MELFNKLKDNSIWDAQIVGKNMFCQNTGSMEYFKEYFSFCINVATWPVEIETRTFFVNEAELALNVYSEKCCIDESSLDVIRESRSLLVSISQGINALLQKQAEEEEQNTFTSNNKALAELTKLKSEMSQVKNQSQFEAVLNKMSSYEEGLDKTALTQAQSILYNSLTRDFSSLVSKKMTEISQLEDIAYNKNAAESFKKAYELFKANEDNYKNSDSKLYELVSKYLFAYDAKRLFNECLVYYNYIYSYIFNKLEDDGKYRFTQFSFDTPKKC